MDRITKEVKIGINKTDSKEKTDTRAKQKWKYIQKRMCRKQDFISECENVKQILGGNMEN